MPRPGCASPPGRHESEQVVEPWKQLSFAKRRSERSAELTEIDPTAIAARSPWQLFWRRFREDKLALASLVFLACSSWWRSSRRS